VDAGASGFIARLAWAENVQRVRPPFGTLKEDNFVIKRSDHIHPTVAIPVIGHGRVDHAGGFYNDVFFPLRANGEWKSKK
jgi:hypothetical protein